MTEIKTIEGKLQAKGLKIAIVASRFNDFIVKELIDGAIDSLCRHGCEANNITIIKVPGAFEIPKMTKLIADQKKHDGIICLGAVIRGATPHFDFIANEVVKGLAQINLQETLPVSLGVLTTDNIEQAIERAGTKVGNKGAEAALACIEMIQCCNCLK